MKKYKYIGSVRTAAGNRLIFPGCTYELSESDEHVKSLVAKKLLQEVEQVIEVATTDITTEGAPAKSAPKKQSTNKENSKK